MSNPNIKVIHVTWSGGIDSTGVIGQLLMGGWTVHPVTLLFGPEDYQKRERQARNLLHKEFTKRYPQQLRNRLEVDGTFLEDFSADGVEIPRRNKHILDYMMMNHVIPGDGYYIGMGEYIGADTWAVKDHIGAHDADSRYLAAYLLYEYGLNYRFIALNDFGESRYKADRVKLLIDSLGPVDAMKTTNCMVDGLKHCGECYKCVERCAAFWAVVGYDTTEYIKDPRQAPFYNAYQMQMNGNTVNLEWDSVNTKKGEK